MSDRTEAIRRELEQIRQRTGILKPEDVVEFASDPATALHHEFTWDDTEAARQYRLWQARQVIRVNVMILPECSEPVRAYISLTPDRKEPGGGYRSLPEVLSDADRRSILLADAMAELRVFRKKYATLKELAGVFEAIEQVEQAAKPAGRKTPRRAVSQATT